MEKEGGRSGRRKRLEKEGEKDIVVEEVRGKEVRKGSVIEGLKGCGFDYRGGGGGEGGSRVARRIQFLLLAIGLLTFVLIFSF